MISPVSNDITVYLIDIAWNGYIQINTNESCKVNIVLCGENMNANSNYFMYLPNRNGELLISGLSGQDNQIITTIFSKLDVINSDTMTRKISIKDLTINTNSFMYKNSPRYNDEGLYFDNVKLFANESVSTLQFNTVNFYNSDIHLKSAINGVLNCTNSTLNLEGDLNGKIDFTDSIITNKGVLSGELYCKNSSLTQDGPNNGIIKALDSFDSIINLNSAINGIVNCNNSTLIQDHTLSGQLNFTDCIIEHSGLMSGTIQLSNSELRESLYISGVLDGMNSSIWLTSTKPSSFSRINLDHCSLYSSVKFTGTPVDLEANDLYLKKIRIRNYPNTYVMVSVNQGEFVRLKTDSNGFLYPYVKAGTNYIEAFLDDGQEFYATFPAVTEDDTTITNMIETNRNKPVIEASSQNQNIKAGEKLFLYVKAIPGNSANELSYQWYKNNSLLSGEITDKVEKVISEIDDSGIYYCVVTENGGGFTKSSDIKVIVETPSVGGAPAIALQASDMNLVTGSSLTLNIKTFPNVETDTLVFEWLKDGVKLNTSDHKLELSNISPEQSGTYECVVREKKTNVTLAYETVKITVQDYRQ